MKKVKKAKAKVSANPKAARNAKAAFKAKASPGRKAAPKSTRESATVAKVEARLIEGPIPYLEALVRERVTEASMVRVFETVRGQVSRHRASRLLIDVRGGSVALTISDMLGLAKMVAATFAGVLERFAIVLRPQDLPSEKFFEPSVSSRGLPTFATVDPAEAVYWVTAKIRPVR